MSIIYNECVLKHCFEFSKNIDKKFIYNDTQALFTQLKDVQCCNLSEL